MSPVVQYLYQLRNNQEKTDKGRKKDKTYTNPYIGAPLLKILPIDIKYNYLYLVLTSGLL